MFSSYHEENGRINEEGLVLGYDANGELIKDGKWMIWDPEGLLKEEIIYDNGKRNGLTILFSPMVIKMLKLFIMSQFLDGEWCLWYNNGIKKELGYFKGEKGPGHYGLKMDKESETNFKNNKIHGSYTEWNEKES